MFAERIALIRAGSGRELRFVPGVARTRGWFAAACFMDAEGCISAVHNPVPGYPSFCAMRALRKRRPGINVPSRRPTVRGGRRPPICLASGRSWTKPRCPAAQRVRISAHGTFFANDHRGCVFGNDPRGCMLGEDRIALRKMRRARGAGHGRKVLAATPAGLRAARRWRSLLRCKDREGTVECRCQWRTWN